jgi:hypothetical protein
MALKRMVKYPWFLVNDINPKESWLESSKVYSNYFRSFI